MFLKRAITDLFQCWYQAYFSIYFCFALYAWYRKKLTEEDCNAFMDDVRAKGSRLPVIASITQYKPKVML